MDSRGLTLLLSVWAFTFVERCNGQTATAESATPASASAATTPIVAGKAKWNFEYTTLKKGKLCIAGNQDSINHCASLKEEITTNFHKDKNLTNVEGGQCFYVSDGPAANQTTTGTVTAPDGTATTPAGTVTAPDGTVTTPAGTGTTPAGTGTTPAGTGTTPAGTGTTPAGTGTTPAGTVTAPAGTATPSGTQHQGPIRCVYKAKYTNKEGKVGAVRLHFHNNNKDPKGKGDVVLLVVYWGDANQPQNLIETPLS